MKVEANAPLPPEGIQRRIAEEGLRIVAERVDRFSRRDTHISLSNVVVQMPVPFQRVNEGYYSEHMAAHYFANRLFKQLLPQLPSGAREDDIVARAVSHGEDMGKYKAVTPERLQEFGLRPTWSVEIDGARYHLSDPFLNGSRTVFVAWVEQMGEVHLRTFYTSNSSALWRSASHRQPFGGWIGKGFDEQSTDVPLMLMEQLSLRSGDPRSDISPSDGSAIFYGLLEIGGHKPSEEGFWVAEQRDLVQAHGDRLRGPNPDKTYGVPENYTWNDPTDAPDFSAPLNTYTLSNNVYGPMTAYVFVSHNLKLKYLFYREETNGRAWLGSVEDTSSMVTIRGARRVTGMLDDLTMPLYEYDSQIPFNYCGPQNPRDPHYCDAWEYIRRLSVIQELFQAMGWSMPPGLTPDEAEEDTVVALLAPRSRTWAVNDLVRIRRSSGVMVPARVISVAANVATVSFYVGADQTGTKPVPFDKCQPYYQAGEQVNVPRSSGKTTVGVIKEALANDMFQCAFDDPVLGPAEKPVSGPALDDVN